MHGLLPAGATQISITVKDGGMKMLQIQDNGHGIRVSAGCLASSSVLMTPASKSSPSV